MRKRERKCIKYLFESRDKFLINSHLSVFLRETFILSYLLYFAKKKIAPFKKNACVIVGHDARLITIRASKL